MRLRARVKSGEGWLQASRETGGGRRYDGAATTDELIIWLSQWNRQWRYRKDEQDENN